jgi:thymidylate synthase
MQQYLDLLNRIVHEGEDVQSGAVIQSENRKAVCRTLVGQQLRFDLRQGFPIVTTKPVPFDIVADEVLWFLRGETSINTLGRTISDIPEGFGGVMTLPDVKIPKKFVRRKIWDAWRDPITGDLGPIYGYQWRRQEHLHLREPAVFPQVAREELDALAAEHGKATVMDVGFRGTPDLTDPQHKMLQLLWIGMLHRCYDQTRPEYAFYGAKGVHVDPRWLVFSNFQRDAKLLPRWRLKAAFPDEYWLDKDFLATNRYGPDTAVWASKPEQHANSGKGTFFRAASPDGRIYRSISAGRFAKIHDLDASSVYKCLRGEDSAYKGWRFERIDTGDAVPRLELVDQVANVLADLRAVAGDPGDRARRRIILTAWNPPDIPEMGLAPCHTLAQFLPTNGKLDVVCHWRSIDMFLGCPFNIIQYALLAHIFGQLAGLEPRHLVANIADCHLYDNQLVQVRDQLEREPRPLPRLVINDRFFQTCPDLSIEQLRQVDPFWFTLAGYTPHEGKLRAEVAV